MKPTAEMKKHFQSLVDGKAVYVWGANCEKITEEMTTRLFKTYGTSKYNKSYCLLTVLLVKTLLQNC